MRNVTRMTPPPAAPVARALNLFRLRFMTCRAANLSCRGSWPDAPNTPEAHTLMQATQHTERLVPEPRLVKAPGRPAPNPHGGLRPLHQKSTCPQAINLGALRGTNLVTSPETWGSWQVAQRDERLVLEPPLVEATGRPDRRLTACCLL